MNRYRWLGIGAVLTVFGVGVGGLAAAAAPARGDFEVTAPDGRRILLKEDGRWRYIDPKAEAASAEKKAEDKSAEGKSAGDEKKPTDEEKAKDAGEAILSLERKLDGNRICRFGLKLVNNLPFEIRSIVPEFKVYRATGVVYDSVFGAFQFIKPGDSQTREVRFEGIACPDIVRVQVAGGDRCEMGELDKFSPVKGRCLAQVRVVESDLVRFDK